MIRQKPFARLTSQGLFNELSKSDLKATETVGFKSSSYAVAENGGYAQMIVRKKVKEDYSFWVTTIDDTAEAGQDYEPKHQLISMKSHEVEREINIKVIDDAGAEPDQGFFVQLLHEDGRVMAGFDSKTTVTILDNDRAGTIKFKEEVFNILPDKRQASITLKRYDGADGVVSVNVSTVQ